MRTAILHKIAFGFDRNRNALVFQGLLEDGYRFEVVFPIAHVAMVFDAEASELGCSRSPLLGNIETVDGFLGAVEATLDYQAAELSDAAGWTKDESAFIANRLGGKAPPFVASRVMPMLRSTVKLGLLINALEKLRPVTEEDYRALGFKRPTPGILDKIGSAVSSVGKFAYEQTIEKVADQAVAVARAGVNIAKGQNVLKSVAGALPTGDLKVVGQYAGTIPGIGTGIGALASGANAALSGKSLTEIAKATAVGAIPGGPLAQAAVSAAVNVAQQGVEGHNMVKAAAGELINAAVSMAPAATQNILRQTAMAAISGNNVLTAAQHATIQTALAQVPDASARAMLSNLASGSATPTSLVQAAGGQLAGKVIGAAPSGAVSRLLNQAAAIAPATPHFPAIGAAGLAAAAAGFRAARLASAPATPRNVANLARLRTNVQALIDSGHSQAKLITAGLQSAALHAA